MWVLVSTSAIDRFEKLVQEMTYVFKAPSFRFHSFRESGFLEPIILETPWTQFV